MVAPDLVPGSSMQSDQNLPYYNDLDATLVEAWRLLARGVTDRRHGFHHPVLGTVGLDGSPQLRTVILRAAEASTRTLSFHTDRRSLKVEELRVNPMVGLHFYDEKIKVQLRMSGVTLLHMHDDFSRERWEASQPMSRVCYSIDPGPGTEIGRGDAFRLEKTDGSASIQPGFEQFVVVTVTIDSLEWLFLAVEGHRRARFIWDAQGGLGRSWLAP